MEKRQNIIEQLGFKKVCLQCKVEASKRYDGRLKNFNCYNCGACYDDIGIDNPTLAKKMVYREFQEKGIILSDRDVELVFNFCKTRKEIPFGTALNRVLEGKLQGVKR